MILGTLWVTLSKHSLIPRPKSLGLGMGLQQAMQSWLLAHVTLSLDMQKCPVT